MVLHPKVIELVQERGWSGLNEIQVEASKYIAEGYNVLIVAPTGYGKTEAAILPVMSRILYENAKPIAVVYVTPLRALINDITRRLREWGDRLGIVVARRHSDISKSEKKLRLRKTPHILVITPEGLEIELDWAHKFRRFYKNVRWVIIDEVHDLIGTKRGAQLALLISRLRKFTGRDLQIIMLSATVGDPLEVSRYFIGCSKRPLKIVTSYSKKPMEIAIHFVEEDWSKIAVKVAELLEPPTIIFVNSRYAGERLREELERLGIRNVMVHHSSVSKELREETERLLKEGRLVGVIATKTLELGIDIGYVRKVIVVGSPIQVQTLLQRVGRSGHSMREPMRGAIIVWHPVQLLEAMSLVRLAERGVLEIPNTRCAPKDVVARMIVGYLLKASSPVKIDELYEIVRGTYAYRHMTYEEFLKLVKYLAKNRLVEMSGEGLRIGPRFYTTWRFEHDKYRGTRGFTEFFTFISSLPEFVVKTREGCEVGKLDSHYVFRYLRVDDVVRLAGRAWKVVRIDDHMYTIEVEPAATSSGEVPLWRGETAKRSGVAAREMAELLRASLNSGNRSDVLLSVIRSIAEKYIAEIGVLPSTNTVIKERVGSYVIYTFFSDEKALDALAQLMLYILSSKEGLDVEIRVSHVGIAVKSRMSSPLEELVELSEDEWQRLTVEALKRSPYFRIKTSELSPSFGARDDEEELVEEVVVQLKQEHYDFDAALKILKDIKNGKIEIINAGERREPLPLAEYLMRLPPQRPWIHDVFKILYTYLTDDAFTVDELSELLSLPARYLENKLKEMRKNKYRATYFIDIDTFEKRWTLAESLPMVAERVEFAESFRIYETGEVYKVMIRRSNDDSYKTQYIRASMADIEKIARELGSFGDLLYELRIEPAYGFKYENQSFGYYYVPAEAVKYMILNAIACIQRLRMSGNPT